MKQPELDKLRRSLFATDPLEIVKAFERFSPDEIDRHGIDAVRQHRLCCLAELIVDVMRVQLSAGRGSRLAELTKQHIKIEKLTDELCTWKERCCELRERLDATCHVLVESGVVPGCDCACRCEACRQVSIFMDEAGFLDHAEDRWWSGAEKPGGEDATD